MKKLYHQLSETFQGQWPDSKITSGIDQYEQRPFYKFTIQKYPRRELKIELTPSELRVSCIFENKKIDYPIGGSHTVTIENTSDSKYLLYTIQSETLETNCYSCLQSVIVDQMKQALLLSDNY